jgi:putative ABC transport system substrate-binding protein
MWSKTEDKDMKKLLSMTMIIFILGTILTGCATKEVSESNDNKELIKIGVTQIVEHPSLDTIRDGIYKALEDNGYIDGENVELDFLNAQGDMQNVSAIATEFENEKKDVVVAITTPSAQAIFNTVKSAPIVYSAVTDPKSAGLEGDNITGVSDMTPVRKQLELLKEYFPQAKRVGMIFDSGEVNSQVQLDLAKEVAKDLGLEIVESGITSTNEIAEATEYILSQVDAIYAQKDNTLASAFPIVVEKADNKNIPIIGAVTDFVDAGAVATDGPSEYQIGYETGQMVVRILKGDKVLDIEPSLVNETKLYINEEAAKKYGVEIN